MQLSENFKYTILSASQNTTPSRVKSRLFLLFQIQSPSLIPSSVVGNPLPFLSDPTTNRSQRSSPTFLPTTHPSIPASNTSRYYRGTHQLSRPGKQVRLPKTFTTSSSAANPVSFLVLQENSCSSLSSPLPASPVDPTGLILLPSFSSCCFIPVSNFSRH